MPYKIRPMEPSDVPRVAAIDRLSFPTPWPQAAFLHELRRRRARYYVLLKPEADESAASGRGWGRWLRQTLGLERGSRVIGYVGFRFQRREAHLTTIAVHPDWRGKGLGELLLLMAIEKMLAQRVSRVTLEMRPSNEVAHHLYRKYGFQLRDTHRGYYRDGEDAWLMEVEVNGNTYRAQLHELRQALEEQLRRQRIDVRQKVGDAL